MKQNLWRIKKHVLHSIYFIPFSVAVFFRSIMQFIRGPHNALLVKVQVCPVLNTLSSSSVGQRCLGIGQVSPFHRPRRPLGRVEV